MLAKAARLLGWLIQRSRDSLLPTSGRIYGLGENHHPIFQQISQTQRWMLRTRVISQATKFLCYRANNFHSSPSTVEGELLNQIIYRHCRLKTKNTELLLVLFLVSLWNTRRLEHLRHIPVQDGTTLLSPLFLNLIQIWLRSTGGWNLAPPQCNLLFVWCWAPPPSHNEVGLLRVE